LPFLSSVVALLTLFLPLLLCGIAYCLYGFGSRSAWATVGFSVAFFACLALSSAWHWDAGIRKIEIERVGRLFVSHVDLLSGQLLLAGVFAILAILHGIAIMRTDRSQPLVWPRLVFLLLSLLWSLWTVLSLSLILSARAVRRYLGFPAWDSSLLRAVSVAFPSAFPLNGFAALNLIRSLGFGAEQPFVLSAVESITDYFREHNRTNLLCSEILGARTNVGARLGWGRGGGDQAWGFVPMVLLFVLTGCAIAVTPDSEQKELWRMTCFVLLLASCSMGYGVRSMADAFRFVFWRRRDALEIREAALAAELRGFYRHHP
jgi:hypothetical protein